MFEMSGLENDQVAVVRGKRGGSRMVGRGSLGTMRPQGERKEMPGADRALRTGLQLMGGPRTLCWPQCTHGAAHTFHSLTHTQQRNSDSVRDAAQARSQLPTWQMLMEHLLRARQCGHWHLSLEEGHSEGTSEFVTII